MSRLGSVGRADVAVAAGLGGLGVVLIQAGREIGSPSWITRPGWPLSIALLIMTVAPVATRRRYPATSLAACITGLVLARLTYVPEPWATSVALFLTFQAAGRWASDRARYPVRIATTAAALAALGWLVVDERQHLVGEISERAYYVNAAASVAINLVFLAAAWWLGDVDRTRAERESELGIRTLELEAERELNTRRVVLAERLRIAREVHDVVAHHVSVMGIQAGAARRLLRSTGGAGAEEPLLAIEASSRSAVVELQRLLAFLRSDDALSGAAGNALTGTGQNSHRPIGPGGRSEAGEPVGSHGLDGPGGTGGAPIGRGDRQPVPGMDQFPALRRQLADAGLACSLEVVGEERLLAPAVDLSAYRIIQESLTNVLKHAGVDRARVRLTYGSGALRIEVANEVRAGKKLGRQPAGSGAGIRGMQERAALVGGRLNAGRATGGGFEVEAELPYDSRVPA